jgi:phospholipase C
VRRRWFCAIAAGLALAGCSAGAGTSTPDAVPFHQLSNTGTSPIQHVVIVIQENRSFDDLFALFPGANGAKRGLMKVKQGTGYIDKSVKLAGHSLIEKRDFGHCHVSYETDLDGGKMDGFNLAVVGGCGGRGIPAGRRPYQFVKESDIEPYWAIAQHWVLADDMFQTQGSGSFTAHQDLIRGGTCVTSIVSCETPDSTTRSLINSPDSWPWGCDVEVKKATVSWIDENGQVYRNGPFPCSNRFPDYGSDGYKTLRDLLDAKSVSWKFYTPCFAKRFGCSPSSGCPSCDGDLLNAFDVIYPVRYGPEWTTNISMPETNIFNDLTSGNLPAVSWVIPADNNSDHPGEPIDDGPSWVASVVNAIGESGYWNSTAIFVVWDDWGGFYDNAVPPFTDNFGGLGFRVPALVVSPYDIAGTTTLGGYITHTQFEFGSILRYIENNWDLGALGTSDIRAKNIGEYVFDYSQAPRSFSAIPSRYSARYFENQPHPPQHGDPE